MDTHANTITQSYAYIKKEWCTHICIWIGIKTQIHTHICIQMSINKCTCVLASLLIHMLIPPPHTNVHRCTHYIYPIIACDFRLLYAIWLKFFGFLEHSIFCISALGYSCPCGSLLCLLLVYTIKHTNCLLGPDYLAGVNFDRGY